MATYEEIMNAARNADAAGDEDAARRLVQMAIKARDGNSSAMKQRAEAAKAGTLQASPEALERAAQADEMALREMNTDRSLKGRVLDNVIGVDDAIVSPGERVGDYVRGATAAVARGMADIPAIPANLAQLGALGIEKATGMESPSMVSRGLSKLPDTRDMLSQIPVIGPESEYKAPGTAGDFISTMGEFAGGAGVAAGPGAMVRYGALPGAASELAGQATEGTKAEPYARTAAALATSLAATPKPDRYGRGLARVDDEARESANYMAQHGVRPTAGQVMDSQRLMKMEGSLSATPSQQEAFTRAALKMAGNETAKRATPQTLNKTQKAITDGMNNILNIDAPIPPAIGQRVMTVADDYFSGTAGRDLPVSLRKVSDELLDLATQPVGSTIPAKTLRKWRTILGQHTTSNQEATRFAAHELREVIDDVTESALASLGRSDDIAALGELRTQYRNFMTIADASTRGGREGARGILSPERLDGAAKRVMGRTNYATEKGTELSKLSRRGVGTIGAAPTVTAGGIRDVLTPLISSGGLGGAGAMSGAAAGMSLPGILAMTAGGAALPVVGRGMLNSGVVQSGLMDLGNFAKPATGTMPGLLGVLSP